MNGLVAPKPAPGALPRWTRHAEFLVYLVPVGTISAELYDGYVRLLQAHSVIAIRSLTRPGGYSAELSPFRSFAWDGAGAIRFRFVSTTDKIDSFDGEDVHACARAVGVLGICHCPTTPSLSAAYEQFMDSIRHFPGLLIQKCFAFEHQFDLRTSEECAALSHLVMFPVYHELAASDDIAGGGGGDGGHGGASASGEVMSTVSLHLQVVLDTVCVTILMSLESTVRAAVRQQHTHGPAPSTAVEMGDAAGFLLDTNVEPSAAQQQQQLHHANALSPFASRDALSSGASSPSARALPSTPTNEARNSTGAGASGGGVASLFVSAETRNRRRHLARQRKLFGDYAVLLSCLPDAIDHYVAAIELLRDEERKSGGSVGDLLWLAAALEGYVFCLCQQSQDKFVVEIVEKASEAVALYAKVGVNELEISLVEHIAGYYTAVAVQLSSGKGLEKVEEGTWIKRLLWEAVERGVMAFSELPVPRQVHFLIQSASMLETVGHQRRMALVLHEAVALLAQRWQPSHGMIASPGSQTSQPHQRAQELRAALRLELITAQRLGMADRSKWEATSFRRRTRRLRRLQRQHHQRKAVKVSLSMALQEVEPWLILRFHVLRQLIAVAKMIADPILIGRHCIQLLHVLAWCDEVASQGPVGDGHGSLSGLSQLDQPQMPFSSENVRSNLATINRSGLHSRIGGGPSNSFSGVYATPPASIETKAKRYFNITNSPSATMSSAAATITSTISNTPRTLLPTPRQFSAAVSAISTKATPAFSSFSNSSSGHHASPSSVSAFASRSSNASSTEFLHGGAGVNGSASHNGTRRSAVKSDAMDDNTLTSLDTSAASSAGGGSDGLALPVWDLRSRSEIQRAQKWVLSLMETECAIMRPTEQIKLESFICVDKMRICYETHRGPLLKREVVLERYGFSATKIENTSSESSAFFYNPFDSKKPNASTEKSLLPPSSGSESESEENDRDDAAASEFERCFPASEYVQVEVILSNPLGMTLDIQQISVWVTSGISEPVDRLAMPPITTATEAYPGSVELKPYEKKKRIVLGVRGLRVGSFHIVGCFIKVLNIKTSFRLKAPIQLHIVKALPALSISLVEIGSLSEDSSTSAFMDAGRDGAGNLDGPASAAPFVDSDPIWMFTNEIKKCVLHVRNNGQRPVHTLHVSIRAGKASMSFNLAQAKTVCSSVSGQKLGSELLAFENEAMSFKCLVGNALLESLMPLERGDHMAIPFEVALLSVARRLGPGNHQEQLQWTFLYGDEDVLVPNLRVAPLYYRESQQIVTLIPLASLVVHSVRVLPNTSVVGPPTATELYDHANCLVVVEVANPTETVFLLRIRTRFPSVAGDQNGPHDNTNAEETDWDVEVGRQSSRALMIELPRLQVDQITEKVLADVLNSSIKLTWKTYFNTAGCLLFHDGLWSDLDEVTAKQQLCCSDVTFDVIPSGETQDAQLNIKSLRANEPVRVLPRFPFHFYQPGACSNKQHWLVAKLFEPCALTIWVRKSRALSPALNQVNREAHVDTVFLEAEVSVLRESDSPDAFDCVNDESVLIAGQSKRILSSAAAQQSVDGSLFEWEWHVQLVFISEGTFQVAVSACSMHVIDDEGGAELGPSVTCHRPLRITCTE